MSPTITLHICDGSHQPLASTEVCVPTKGTTADLEKVEELIQECVKQIGSIFRNVDSMD